MIQYKRVITTLISTYMLFFAVPSEAKVENRSQFSNQLIGKATYYSDKFHGRPTASGEIYDKNDLTTAAHTYFPLGSILRVTNLKNNLSVNVRVNDRGRLRGKHLDLSKKAATKLGFVGKGWANVKIERVQQGLS